MELERLINRHKDQVYRQMVRVCGNYSDAEDALADALVSAVRASDQLRDPLYFQAWLSKIGTRACIRNRFKERLFQLIPMAELESKWIEIVEPSGGPDVEFEASQMKACVSGAVTALPELYREVYLRREILGEKAEDVAGALGLSLPAVKSRLRRAREMVRSSLDSGFGCAGIADSLS